MGKPVGDGLKAYYKGKIEELELLVKDKTHNLRRLEAQRNELNTHGLCCREEPSPLQMVLYKQQQQHDLRGSWRRSWGLLP